LAQGGVNRPLVARGLTVARGLRDSSWLTGEVGPESQPGVRADGMVGVERMRSLVGPVNRAHRAAAEVLAEPEATEVDSSAQLVR